ncbi:MAG: glycosyltransferase [Saprospirales bacterium]|jgi:glycosyltransferase involved in cell wall biosynthesis|nr:glycosyltransferase [Saprospirales bacterium]
MSSPSFSIITVVFNGAGLLPGTAESVRAQTYPHIEYILVDGGSTDGTVDLIRAYAARMPNLRWISEKDNGLYDAMNKGQRMATGDFVWFLNCGDHLHAPDTVEKLAALATDQTDVLYGETLLVSAARTPAGTMSALSTRQLPKRLSWKSYRCGMPVVHQSFIARRTLAPAYIAGNLCADYDWCIRVLKNSRKTACSGLILSDYLMGGMSKQKHRQSLKDRFRVMRVHYGLLPTLLAHGWIAVRAIRHRLRRWGQPRY